MNAFEYLKDNDRTNTMDWLNDTYLITYGVIIGVVSGNVVRAEAAVHKGLSREVFTIPLLSSASLLFSSCVEPQPGDAVLIFFLRDYSPKMFRDYRARYEAVQEWSVSDENAVSYTRFAGVGILVNALSAGSDTGIRHHRIGDSAVITFGSQAHVSAEFRKEVSVIFNALPGDGEFRDRLIQFIFGQHSPLSLEHWAQVKKFYGFSMLPDKSLEEVNAAVYEAYSVYAPITRDIQGAQTTAIGLGTDKDDNPVETDAPVTETAHGKAPVIRDIRGPQTLTVGIGNAESGDDAEEREAPVKETYGSKAPITKDIRSAQKYIIGTGPDGATDAPVDIELNGKSNVTLTSKSGMTAHFDKAVSLDGKEGLDLTFKGKVTFTSDDDFSIEFKGAGTFASTAGGLLNIGNSVATLGGMISDLLTALTNLATEGTPAAHTAQVWAATNIQPIIQKWGQVFN
jgi:hypothetical protein